MQIVAKNYRAFSGEIDLHRMAVILLQTDKSVRYDAAVDYNNIHIYLINQIIEVSDSIVVFRQKDIGNGSSDDEMGVEVIEYVSGGDQ